jgi:hypothetical protein
VRARRTFLGFLVLVVAAAAVPHCWETAAGASEPTKTVTQAAPVQQSFGEFLAARGVVVMVDGEWVQNTPDLWAWLGINHYEHADVWHNEDGRDRLFGGGLQFYQGTWEHMGCGEFAPTPARASINDQIACGRRTKDAVDAEGGDGWTQWPRSSKAVGLR